MARNRREIIKLKSTESHYFYTTTKNRKTMVDKFEIRKFDPVLNKHVLFKEAKIK